MRCILYTFLFCTFFFSAKAQYSINAEIGIGGTTPGYNNVPLLGGQDICSAASLTLGITALKPVTRNTEIGFAVYFQRYAFSDYESFLLFGTDMTINEDCSYLFLAPAFEFWRHHAISLGLQPSIGFLLNGNESTTDNPDNGRNINKYLFQLKVIYRERIYLNDNWKITVSENVGYTFGGFTRTIGASETELAPMFLSLQLGILHLHNFERSY